MTKKIYIIPDGPYEVSGDVYVDRQTTLVDEQGASEKWIRGEPYEVNGETYYLCRCGHSRKKPFCDGTHEKIDFDGELTAHHEIEHYETTEYTGAALDMEDKEDLCASMRFCDRGINAWNAVEESNDPENARLAITQVSNCPSGRLRLRKKDGTPIELDRAEKISTIEDTVHECRGPLWVQGGIPVESSDCREYTRRNRLTLCRCGESSNKPFCDSSHVYCSHMKGFDE